MLVLALQRPVTSCMLVMSQSRIDIVVKVYNFSMVKIINNSKLHDRFRSQ